MQKNIKNDKAKEVMIMNIDRDTVGCILGELNTHEVIDLDYRFIHQE